MKTAFKKKKKLTEIGRRDLASTVLEEDREISEKIKSKINFWLLSMEAIA